MAKPKLKTATSRTSGFIKLHKHIVIGLVPVVMLVLSTSVTIVTYQHYNRKATHSGSLSTPQGSSTPIELTPQEQKNLDTEISLNQPTGQSSTSTIQTPPQPKVLLDISGNGAQQTQSFTALGDWTVTYTFDCSAFDSRGNFSFDIGNTDGSRNYDPGANSLAPNGGTTDYYYDAGQHYLSINSECDWHVTAKG